MSPLFRSRPLPGLDVFLRLSIDVPEASYEELFLLSGGHGDQRQVFLDTLIGEDYALLDGHGNFHVTAKGRRLVAGE